MPSLGSPDPVLLDPGAPRSYRTRQGRMGPELQEVWGQRSAAFAMPAGPWQLPPRTLLEIGCGAGDSLVAAADDFDLAIGVDVHLRGLAAAARSALHAGAEQVRLVDGDAVQVLAHQVPPGSLTEVHVWFPDPWPKRKHHKRRLIQPAFAMLVVHRLAPGGTLRLATDVAAYAEAMIEVLSRTPSLTPCGEFGVVPRPAWRPVTRFEGVAQAQGRAVTELAFTKQQAGLLRP